MKTNCIRQAERGTSLPEVVLAVAILAIMAAGIITSFNYGFITMSMVRENQRATQIIMEKAETIRLYNWDQINTAGYISNSFAEAYDPQGDENSQGVVYQGTLSITNVPFNKSYSTNMRLLNITLSWNSAFSKIPRTRNLTTFIARDGVQNYVY